MTDFGQVLIEAFVEDTSPLVDDVGSYVLELERSLGEGKRAPDLTRRMRARLHTIKGNAGMVGQEAAADLCHILEDACALLDQPTTDTRALIQLLLAGVDQLTGLLASRGASANPRHLAAFRGDLRRVAGVAPAEAPNASELGAEQPIAAAVSVRPSLRIDLAQLDMLLDGLGEAIFLQSTLEAGAATTDAAELLLRDERTQRLGTSLRSLRDLLVRARLVPLGGLFSRYARPLRDLAQERGLEVELVHSGGEQGVDKAICDRLAEPLLHILRNAVAHGIERPGERLSLGKPRVGRITISARGDSDRTVITIADDGRGLNVARLRARAEALGVPTAGLSEEECFALVFMPKISTAEKVDELSGRGVGLDAAAQAVKELGGTLAVQSRSRQGVVFTLNLPSTLSLLRGLVVRVGEERYVLPASTVRSTLRVSPDMLHQVNGQKVLRSEQLLPWVDLAELVALTSAARATPGYAVVLDTGTRRLALGVDTLLGSAELVVKPLEGSFPRFPFVTGAALLADASVSLIVDCRALGESERTARWPARRAVDE